MGWQGLGDHPFEYQVFKFFLSVCMHARVCVRAHTRVYVLYTLSIIVLTGWVVAGQGGQGIETRTQALHTLDYACPIPLTTQVLTQ